MVGGGIEAMMLTAHEAGRVDGLFLIVRIRVTLLV
jgi:hypothetical protein